MYQSRYKQYVASSKFCSTLAKCPQYRGSNEGRKWLISPLRPIDCRQHVISLSAQMKKKSVSCLTRKLHLSIRRTKCFSIHIRKMNPSAHNKLTCQMFWYPDFKMHMDRDSEDNRNVGDDHEPDANYPMSGYVTSLSQVTHPSQVMETGSSMHPALSHIHQCHE